MERTKLPWTFTRTLLMVFLIASLIVSALLLALAIYYLSWGASELDQAANSEDSGLMFIGLLALGGLGITALAIPLLASIFVTLLLAIIYHFYKKKLGNIRS